MQTYHWGEKCNIDEIALDEMIAIKYNNRTKKGSGSMLITVTELKCNLGNDADVEAARAERLGVK